MPSNPNKSSSCDEEVLLLEHLSVLAVEAEDQVASSLDRYLSIWGPKLCLPSASVPTVQGSAILGPLSRGAGTLRQAWALERLCDVLPEFGMQSLLWMCWAACAV